MQATTFSGAPLGPRVRLRPRDPCHVTRVRSATGDVRKFSHAQLFAWDAYNRGQDLNEAGNPTQLAILEKDVKVKKAVLSGAWWVDGCFAVANGDGVSSLCCRREAEGNPGEVRWRGAFGGSTCRARAGLSVSAPRMCVACVPL